MTTGTRVAVLQRGPFAGVIGFAMPNHPGANVWRFRLQGNDSPLWSVATSDLYLLETLPDSLNSRVGAWVIELVPIDGRALADKRGSDSVQSAPLTRFPNGWKVGVWSDPVPVSVRRAADQLAGGLTK